MPRKVTDIKAELEKVSRFIPELRKDLDEAYIADTGKKSKIKLIWKQYEDRYNKVIATPEYKKLH